MTSYPACTTTGTNRVTPLTQVPTPLPLFPTPSLCIYIEALEPHKIDRVLILNCRVRQTFAGVDLKEASSLAIGCLHIPTKILGNRWICRKVLPNAPIIAIVLKQSFSFPGGFWYFISLRILIGGEMLEAVSHCGSMRDRRARASMLPPSSPHS